MLSEKYQLRVYTTLNALVWIAWLRLNDVHEYILTIGNAIN